MPHDTAFRPHDVAVFTSRLFADDFDAVRAAIGLLVAAAMIVETAGVFDKMVIADAARAIAADIEDELKSTIH